MANIVLRIRTVFLPMLFTCIGFFLVLNFQEYWQQWRPVTRELPLWLLPIAGLVALQFNRSRLAYLAFLLVIYYSVNRSLFIDSQYLLSLKEQIFLFGSLSMVLLLLMKDRGIASIHGILALSMFALCAVLTFNLDILLNHANKILMPTKLAYSDIIISIWLTTTLIIGFGTIIKNTLTTTTISLSFVLWSLLYFKPHSIPADITLLGVAILIFISVLFDSYRLAYRDELTGLPSRRALYNLVLSLSNKYCVAMTDIDHFKKFNDTYGHDVGDQVLKLVASKLSKVTGGGKVFRYGGEEFTIIFPRKSVEQTLEHLEAVREEIQNYKMMIRDENRKNTNKSARNKKTNTNKSVSVTISIGVAQHQRKQDFDKTLKAADIALYKAKKQGRNQVCS
ncbi:GGDEF domain-containing protein [Parashewanella tropica]|uniref:GGDEF domain-containing protein n=1 Tax=Parashewanella tropica TaxID=2547970 RepID=UPI001FE46DE7|nr:GGDEF domain-containing protein [Parashewanella tropica]